MTRRGDIAPLALLALVWLAGFAAGQVDPATPRPQIPDPGATTPPDQPKPSEPPLAVISPAPAEGPDAGKSPLGEPLKRAGQAFRDLTGDFRSGALNLADVKTLMVASSVFSSDADAAALAKARERIAKFVENGGVLVAFTAGARSLDFLPDGMEASIERVSHLKRESAFADHPLLAGGMKPADVGGRQGPLYPGGCYGTFKKLVPVVACDAKGRFPVALEGTSGKGRVMLFHIAPGIASAAGSDSDRVSVTLLFENLSRYLQTITAGKAPAIEPPERTITGVVFIDANGSGRRDEGEQALAGMPVSDGGRIVLTDAGGRYVLQGDAYSRFVWAAADVTLFAGRFWREVSPGTASIDIGLVPRKVSAAPGLRIVHLADAGARLAPEAQTDPALLKMLAQTAQIGRAADLLIVSTDTRSAALRAGLIDKALTDRPWLAAFVPTEADTRSIEECDRFNDVFGPARYVVRASGSFLLFEAPTLLDARAAAWRQDADRISGKKFALVFEGKAGDASVASDGLHSWRTAGFRVGGIDPPPSFRVIDIDGSGRVDTEQRVAGVGQLLRPVYPGSESVVPPGPLRIVLSAYDSTWGNHLKIGVEMAHLLRGEGRLRLDELKLPALNAERVSDYTRVIRFPEEFALSEGFYVVKVTAEDEKGERWQHNVSFSVPGKNPPPGPVLGTPWETPGGDERRSGVAADAIAMPLHLFAVTPLNSRTFDAAPLIFNGSLTIHDPLYGKPSRYMGPLPGMGVAIRPEPFCRHRQGTFTLSAAAEIRLRPAEQGAAESVFLFGESAPKDLGRARLLVGGEYLCVVSELGRAWAFGRTHGAPVDDGKYDAKEAAAALRWSVDIAPGCRRAAATDSLLFTGNECLDIVSGKLHWKLAKYVLRDASVALTKTRAIVTGVADEAEKSRQLVLAVDRDSGRIAWEKTLAEVHPNDRVLTAPPTVTSGEVYAGSATGTLFALDLGDGAVKWTYQTGPSILPLSARDEARTGRISAQPVVSGEYVIVAGCDGTVTALAPPRGRPAWQWTAGLPIVSAPAISGNTLVVIDCDGNLYTFVSAQPVKR